MTETNTPERPEWLEQGAEVGILAGRYVDTAEIATVERFTKTQVILTNGDRYSLNGLDRRIGGRGGMGYSVRLVPLSNPRWRRLRAKAVVTRRSGELTVAQRALGNNGTVEDVAQARAAAAALAEAYAMLHRVWIDTSA